MVCHTVHTLHKKRSPESGRQLSALSISFPVFCHRLEGCLWLSINARPLCAFNCLLLMANARYSFPSRYHCTGVPLFSIIILDNFSHSRLGRQSYLKNNTIALHTTTCCSSTRAAVDTTARRPTFIAVSMATNVRPNPSCFAIQIGFSSSVERSARF